MVLSWNIKQVVKKKYPSNPQDQKDWEQFIKHPVNLYNKDNILDEEKKVILKTKKIDLHGLKLNEANELIRKFITNAYEKGYKKLLVVTGKGLRSKIHNNPYRSEEMNTLKYSVPNFIQNNQNLSEKISKISKASLKDGGEGAFYVYLK